MGTRTANHVPTKPAACLMTVIVRCFPRRALWRMSRLVYWNGPRAENGIQPDRGGGGHHSVMGVPYLLNGLGALGGTWADSSGNGGNGGAGDGEVSFGGTGTRFRWWRWWCWWD